jgi:hypothetical protein
MRRGTPVRKRWRMAPDLDMLHRLERADGTPRRYDRIPS